MAGARLLLRIDRGSTSRVAWPDEPMAEPSRNEACVKANAGIYAPSAKIAL